MRFLKCGGRWSAALLSCVLSMPLAASAHAQSGAAGLAWSQFNAANAGWTAEWSATGDQAASLRGLSAPSSKDAATVALSFINANSALLGLAGSDTKFDHRIFDGTDTHVSYQQTVGGLPVFNGFVDVHMNGGGQIYLVNNTAVSSVTSKSLSLRPALSAASATQFAQARRHVFHDKRGVPYTLALSPVAAPELGIQKTEGGGRLAYKVDLGAVAYIIDANTGAVLDTITYIQSATGTGTIFDPNPVNTLNNRTLRDQNDTNYSRLQGAYFSDKTLRDITKTGTGRNTLFSLVGPNVNTVDLSNATLASCGTPAAQVVRKPPGKSNNGRFPVNRSVTNFEFVMAYYHIDKSQRYIQSLGINNWNAAIRVDAHALTVDNSFHCPRPNARGGFLAFGDGGVDDAEEADVVLHEYGHALQANASNGRYSAGNQTRSMGEGFGDYWAFSAKTSGAWAPCFAEWDGQGTCLRRLDTNKKFPRDIVNEEHADGEIWSRGLRDLLIKVGKAKADKIILKSHFLVPNSPTFSQGLTALLDADHQLFRDADKEDICAVFTDRGISAPGCGIWVKISWNKLGADVDLHITPPAPLQEVYYGNTHPNWGDQTTDEDDPLLYQDCISSCTAEQITVSRLVTPGSYQVFVHYYSDHGKGSTIVNMEILRGAQRLFAASHVLARTGDRWNAFRINVPRPKAGESAQPEIVFVDTSSRSPSGPAKK